jgi:hypothetical protein
LFLVKVFSSAGVGRPRCDGARVFFRPLSAFFERRFLLLDALRLLGGSGSLGADTSPSLRSASSAEEPLSLSLELSLDAALPSSPRTFSALRIFFRFRDTIRHRLDAFALGSFTEDRFFLLPVFPLFLRIFRLR